MALTVFMDLEHLFSAQQWTVDVLLGQMGKTDGQVCCGFTCTNCSEMKNTTNFEIILGVNNTVLI